jgi:hypothetical protein
MRRENTELLRKVRKALVEHPGLPQALQFVVPLERGKGDSVAEIKDYWREASIDEIHAKIMEWKEQRA